PENMEWLRAMPYTDEDDTFAYCHGSPSDPSGFDYLFSPEQVNQILAAGRTLPTVTLSGHSHLTLAFRAVPGENVQSLIEDELDLNDDASYIITVGSVGQPRDRDPRACCCTFDTDERILRFHRLHYDVLTARQRIHDAGLSPVFGDRLLVGM
ncbi:MAG: metallophosphoesterase, partial [Myxococcota bacterium]